MLTLDTGPSQRRTPWRSLVGRDWLWLVLTAAGIFVQEAGSYFASHGQPDRAHVDAVAAVLLAAGPITLFSLRRMPVAGLWVVIGATLGYLMLRYPYGPVFLSVIVALFAAVQERHRVAAIAAAFTLYVVCFGSHYLFGIDSPPTLGLLFAVAAWLFAVLAASEVVRMRRASALEAQHVRDEEAQRRRSEERLRIARDLHDVLAHHISLINIQAGVALHLMSKKPEQAETALTAIESASREALSELRSVLDILHQPEEAAPRTPSATLDRLTVLTSRAGATGLAVDTQVEGTPRHLPAAVDAVAFRIVQEALTNVVRHAGANRATVRVAYEPRELVIEVDDDGQGGLVAMGGNGLPGMRERVETLRGHFEAGPLPDRGFRVHAQLPLDGVV